MLRATVCIAFAAGVAAASLSVQAQQVVNWGNRGYVTVSSPLSRVPFPATGVPFSDTLAYSPAAINTAIAGHSSTFYGGSALEGPGNRIILNGQFDTTIRDNGNGDFIQFRADWGPGANSLANTAGTVILFNKADFLAGGDAAPVGLDHASRFQLSVGSQNNGANVRQRLVIRQGSAYAIGTSFFVDSAGSQHIGPLSWTGAYDAPNSAGTPDFPLRTILFSNVVWKQYDPATRLIMTDADFAAAPDYVGGFDDITALGVYIESSRADGTLGDLRNALRVFRADAVVPEPSALVWVGLALLAGRRRR